MSSKIGKFEKFRFFSWVSSVTPKFYFISRCLIHRTTIYLKMKKNAKCALPTPTSLRRESNIKSAGFFSRRPLRVMWARWNTLLLSPLICHIGIKVSIELENLVNNKETKYLGYLINKMTFFSQKRDCFILPRPVGQDETHLKPLQS